MFSERDYHWMNNAIQLAKRASSQNEVPVGAILVANDQLIGEGFNCPIGLSDPTAHAEVIALRQGGNHLNNYRLTNTTLYVTLEPCLMCTGAMIHARIERLVFGAPDPRTGCIHSVFQLLDNNPFNHRITYQGGLLATTCSDLLTEFFRARR